jgi:hypothetical protein
MLALMDQGGSFLIEVQISLLVDEKGIRHRQWLFLCDCNAVWTSKPHFGMQHMHSLWIGSRNSHMTSSRYHKRCFVASSKLCRGDRGVSRRTPNTCQHGFLHAIYRNHRSGDQRQGDFEDLLGTNCLQKRRKKADDLGHNANAPFLYTPVSIAQ